MQAIFIETVANTYKAIGYTVNWIIPGTSFQVREGQQILGEVKTFKGELRFSNQALEDLAKFSIWL